MLYFSCGLRVCAGAVRGTHAVLRRALRSSGGLRMGFGLEKVSIKCPGCGRTGAAHVRTIESRHFILCKKCRYTWTVRFVIDELPKEARSATPDALCRNCDNNDPVEKPLAVDAIKIKCPTCQKIGTLDVLFNATHFYVRHRACGSVWRVVAEYLGERNGNGGSGGYGAASSPGRTPGPVGEA